MPWIQKCPSCGRSNRIPVGRLADTGRCGACHAALPPAAEPLEVGNPLFDEIIQGAKVPVLVDFWATWCGPCRAAAPEVAKTAAAMSGQALVLKVDTEQHPEIAARYRVQSIPNFVVFSRGEVVQQTPGLVRSEHMQGWLRSAGAGDGSRS